MAYNWPHPGMIITLVGILVCFFGRENKTSAMGLVSVFALTGFMGLTLALS